MTATQAFLTVLALALGTLATRALPFLLFPPHRPTPAYIVYLGRVLPCATIGLLIVYCLKNVQPLVRPHGAPELIAIALTAGLQWLVRNTLLSIVAGTVAYMFLVQSVFG
jgi:branched-subunit amino acid transport protein AzlD